MDKLFDELQTAYDPKNRPTMLCQDADGKFFVFKPRTGYKSRGFDSADDTRLLAIFDRVSHCGHNHASYLPGEAPGSELEDTTPVLPVPPVVEPIAPVPPVPPVVEPIAPVPPVPPVIDPNQNQD